MSKITIPIAIMVSALILGLSFFGVQYSKGKSIERQKTAEIQLEQDKIKAEREAEYDKILEANRIEELLDDCLDAAIEVRNSFMEGNGTPTEDGRFELTRSDGETMGKLLKDGQEACFKKYR